MRRFELAFQFVAVPAAEVTLDARQFHSRKEVVLRRTGVTGVVQRPWECAPQRPFRSLNDGQVFIPELPPTT